MTTYSKKVSIKVSAGDRKEPEAIVRSSTSEQRTVFRARIILGFADDKSGYAIAQELSTGFNTVNKWRTRYAEQGLAGLKDAPRSGQPKKLNDEMVKDILDKTMHDLPEASTHWSLRLMSKYTKASPYMVSKVWRAAGLKPHLTSTFNFTKDPDFADKVINIIGLYMSPPDNAIVLSVMKRLRYRHLTAPSPCYNWRPAKWKGIRMTTSGTAPRAFMPPSM